MSDEKPSNRAALLENSLPKCNEPLLCAPIGKMQERMKKAMREADAALEQIDAKAADRDTGGQQVRGEGVPPNDRPVSSKIVPGRTP